MLSARQKRKLPAGLKINVAQNANDFLYASIREVYGNSIEAFILVFYCGVCLLPGSALYFDSGNCHPSCLDCYILCFEADQLV